MMLQSVTRLLLFLALIAALVWGASWLLDAPGGLRIAFADIELNLRPLQAVVAVALALLALWLLLRLLGLAVAFVRFLNGDETALSRYFHRRRHRRGLEALQGSLLALASGEGGAALAGAQKAAALLDRPQLTGPLIAQAAEAAGEPAQAEAAWKALLARPESRFAGLRGLMRERLAQGDRATALELARRGFALRPTNAELQDTLLDLQAQAGDWAGARQTLAQKGRQGLLPRDVVRRREAVLMLAEAASAPDSPSAREAAIAANRLAPGLVPAAALAAEALAAQGKARAAARVLKRAWAGQPHPDLAAAFARLAPDETPEARLRRFEALTGTRPEDPESRLLRAELLIAAGDFPQARRALSGLLEHEPTARTLALMAAISRGEGEAEAIARGWLARALVAPRGPQWTCAACGRSHDAWQPLCAGCGALDTLAWSRPAGAATSLPGSAEMLPLIVGAPEPEVREAEPPGPEPEADAAAESSSESPEPPDSRT